VLILGTREQCVIRPANLEFGPALESMNRNLLEAYMERNKKEITRRKALARAAAGTAFPTPNPKPPDDAPMPSCSSQLPTHGANGPNLHVVAPPSATTTSYNSTQIPMPCHDAQAASPLTRASFSTPGTASPAVDRLTASPSYRAQSTHAAQQAALAEAHEVSLAEAAPPSSEPPTATVVVLPTASPAAAADEKVAVPLASISLLSDDETDTHQNPGDDESSLNTHETGDKVDAMNDVGVRQQPSMWTRGNQWVSRLEMRAYVSEIEKTMIARDIHHLERRVADARRERRAAAAMLSACKKKERMALRELREAQEIRQRLERSGSRSRGDDGGHPCDDDGGATEMDLQEQEPQQQQYDA